MNRFIVHENIRRFHRLLEQKLDPAQRRLIEGLLAAEEAKLTPDHPAPDQSPHTGR